MPKVSSAQVSLRLKPQQPNRLNEYPIVITVAFNGRKEKTTGIRCRKEDWDKKRQTIKNTANNAPALNMSLQSQLNNIIQKRNFFELNNIHYTAEDLISNISPNNTIDAVITEMNRVRQWSNHTYELYQYVSRTFHKFNPSLQLNDIDDDIIIGYSKYLKQKGMKNNTVRANIGCLQGICNYAFKHKMMDHQPSFEVFRKYKSDTNKRALSIDQLRAMRQYVNTLKDSKEKYNLSVYLIAYYFQGLALCDLMRIQKTDLHIDNNGRLIYQTKRQKTNIPVNIVIDCLNKGFWDLYSYLYDKSGDYFINSIQNGDPTKTQETKVYKMRHSINRTLKHFAYKANMGLITECMMCDDFPSDLTFYSIRHSFATNYIQNHGNPFYLANLMGRSENGISRYVKSLTSIDEISKEKQIIQYPD